MQGIDTVELLIFLRKIKPEIKVIVMPAGNKDHADTYLNMVGESEANIALKKLLSYLNY